MSILLIGAQGQVGQELLKALGKLSRSGSDSGGELAGDEALGPVVAMGRAQLDLADVASIFPKVTALRPKLIVNAAAYTAVDKAESEPDLAYCINAQAPQVLALAAADCGAGLVHISTDYVFSGQMGTPRCETDDTNPVNVYGNTKLAGELAIREVLDKHIILRTAWVYGIYGKGNFLKTMLRLGQDRSEVNVVCDQVGSPTWARDIAYMIAQLSGRLCGLEDASEPVAGTYHYTNSGVASWYDFAIAIFQEAKALGLPLNIETVNPIPTADYPTPATRPAYSVLNCQKLARTLGYSAPHWRASLRAMLHEYASE